MFRIYRFIILVLILFLRTQAYASAQEALTWQDCIKEAQKNHPDLIIAQEQIKESEATKKVTASPQFPQVNADAAISTSKAATSKKSSKAYSYGLSADQLLFDGFKTRDNVNAALEDIKAAKFSYRFTSSDIRLKLRTAFINLLKAQELVNINQEIFNIRKGNFELITLRYESGIEHKGALLSAEANLLSAKFDIAKTKRELIVAQRQLLKEMGKAGFVSLEVKGDFKVKDSELEKPDLESLADKNPQFLKAIAQKNAAAFDIKAAKAGFGPEVLAQAGISKTSSHWPPENKQWNTGLAFSLPVFEGGLKFAQLEQAKSLYNQAEANQKSIRDSVIVSLEQNWAALLDAVETVDVRRKFLSAAEERAKIAEAQYSLGLIQFDNWTIIEDDLVSAKKSFLDVQANALLAEANLIYAKGETLEYAN